MRDERTMPRVSVVLPTYNRAYCVSRAIESVLRQTYHELELIVVDDCSSDDTQALLERFADPRLRVLRHEYNKGGAAARNTGVAAARSPLIAFQDSDDEWCVTMLEKQLARRAEMGPEYGLSYCAKIIHGRDNHGNFGPRYAAYMPSPDRVIVEGNVLNEVLYRAIVSTQTLVVTKQLLVEVGGFDESLRVGLDWELSIRLARRTKFAFIEEPLVMTYLMSDSITHRRLSGAYTTQVVMEKHRDLMDANAALRGAKLFQIGRVYQRGGQYRKALSYLFGAVKARPGHLSSWLALAISVARAPFSVGQTPD